MFDLHKEYADFNRFILSCCSWSKSKSSLKLETYHIHHCVLNQGFVSGAGSDLREKKTNFYLIELTLLLFSFDKKVNIIDAVLKPWYLY